MATDASDRRDRRIHKVLARLHGPLERLGLHLTRAHFYSPIPTLRELDRESFGRLGQMPGVDMRGDDQLALLERAVPYIAECAELPLTDPGGSEPSFYQRNTQFERVDFEVLHAMIRIHKPRRIIEIGAGFSTLIATRAVAMNRAEDPTYDCRHVCIDPVPREFLSGLDGVDEVIARRVQDLDPALFGELTRDDILFVDSSHVVKIGSDAQFEFLELIPRLEIGVHVHVHDIFFPRDYPEGFVVDYRHYFNEQYVLQAFLAFNEAFHVTWSGSWMAEFHRDRIAAAFPSFVQPGHWPSSLWMQRVG